MITERFAWVVGYPYRGRRFWSREFIPKSQSGWIPGVREATEAEAVTLRQCQSVFDRNETLSLGLRGRLEAILATLQEGDPAGHLR